MKFAIIIYSNDSETAWNAFRFANTTRSFDNEVNVFLLGKGVEVAMISTLQYDVLEQVRVFLDSGGKIIGCGVCCESRKSEMPFLLEDLKCEMGSMRHLYALVAEADKVLTF
jgi:sulfur relay (sulfurtransferase) complex TusBCD TusD component (DsrE family)